MCMPREAQHRRRRTAGAPQRSAEARACLRQTRQSRLSLRVCPPFTGRHEKVRRQGSLNGLREEEPSLIACVIEGYGRFPPLNSASLIHSHGMLELPTYTLLETAYEG